MKTTKYLVIAAALGLGLSAVACSSSSSCADGGICDGAGGSPGVGGAGGGPGPSYFALTPGTYCFDIIAIAPGSADGCQIGVADLVTTGAKRIALPVTYYNAATTLADGTPIPQGTVEVGTNGSLGRGVVDMNTGTLLQGPSTQMLPAPDDACSWLQADTSTLTLTAENTFTIAVAETDSQFMGASTCAAAQMPVPTTASCTSTWTWTMAIENPQVFLAPSCQ